MGWQACTRLPKQLQVATTLVSKATRNLSLYCKSPTKWLQQEWSLSFISTENTVRDENEMKICTKKQTWEKNERYFQF